VLDLSNNFFRRFSAQLLLKSLRFNRCLISLNLSSNQISDHDAIVSAMFLEGNTSLQSLDLSSNQIENNGCIALAYCLSQLSCINFTLLNLLGNNIGSHAHQFVLERMLFVLHQNHEIHYAMNYQESNRRLFQPMYSLSSVDKVLSSTISSVQDNDHDHIKDKSRSSPCSPKSRPKARIFRLFNILCEPSVDKGLLSQDKLDWLNPSGKFNFDLSNAFDSIHARIILDIIESNPCSTVEEMSWFNDISKTRDCLTLARSVHRPMEQVASLVNAHIQNCSNEKRFSSNTTPRQLYQEKHDISMSNPYNYANNLIALLQELVILQNQSVDIKLKSTHLFAVQQLFVKIGDKLSLDMSKDLIFFLLDRWNHFEYMHNSYHTNDIYGPWEQLVSTEYNKSSKLFRDTKVFQDIDDSISTHNQSMNNEPKQILSDVIVMLKFIVCSVFDFLSESSHMDIQKLYKNKQLLLSVRSLTAEQVTLPIAHLRKKFSAAFDYQKPGQETVKMDSYELLVRMISELSMQYNTHPLLERDQVKQESVYNNQTEKSERNASDDPVNFVFIEATQFMHYVLLQLLQSTMLSCPYQSAKYFGSAISDFRSEFPSHGTLTIVLTIPMITSRFDRIFSKEKQYLLNAWHALLSFDHTSFEKDNILIGTTNDTDRLFSNVWNLISTLKRILEYDVNILCLSCEQAELVLKILCFSKDRGHLQFIERLVLQISTSEEASRFLVRNCYLHEVGLFLFRFSRSF
jgi:hypothetical protein